MRSNSLRASGLRSPSGSGERRRLWSAAPAPETLRLLAALLAGDWLLADGSDDRHRREGSGLTAAFLQWHLERGIRSLRMVER